MKPVPRRTGSQPYLVEHRYRDGGDDFFAMLSDLSAWGWPPMSADLETLLLMHCPCRRCGLAVHVFADHITCAPGPDWWGDRVVLTVPAVFVGDVDREEDPVGKQRRREYVNAKSRDGNRIRREQILAGGQRHTDDEIRALYEVQEGHCFYCYAPLRIDNYKWDVARDHFVPLARGGHDGISNIVLACRLCNNRKVAKEGHGFLRKAKLAASGEVRELLTLLHRRHRSAYPDIWAVAKRVRKTAEPRAQRPATI
jgi:5-methylcytosine-specific restriction endonuclease McrA